jgi:hypothetical protein
MDNETDNEGGPENPSLAGVRGFLPAIDSCGIRFVPGGDGIPRRNGFYGETLGL